MGLLLALTFGLLVRIERLCRDFFALATIMAVSYTHLTLPTSDLV